MGKYKNQKTEIEHYCKIHQRPFMGKPQNLIKTQGGCIVCKREKGVARRTPIRYNIELVMMGSHLIALEDYKTDKTPILHKCRKCGHEGMVTPHNVLNGSGCLACAREKRRGENHYRWTGRERRDFRTALRSELKEWRFKVMKKHNFTCQLSGETNVKLNVHHIVPFKDIVDKCLDCLGLEEKPYASDYDKETYNKIKDWVIAYHENNDVGITLSATVHRQFHSTYGNKNNTPLQFEEFSNDYKQKKLMPQCSIRYSGGTGS